MTATEQCAILRAALVGLVGVDGKDDLEQMEAVMRLTPAPAADKAVTIDAIHALIATLPIAMCSARHDSTGALCCLPKGHTENHLGNFVHGVSQWPEPDPAMTA